MTLTSRTVIGTITAITLAMTLTGCKLFGGGGSDDDDATPKLVTDLPPTPGPGTTMAAVRLVFTVLDGGGEGTTTYAQHVKPIFDAHCISCHASGTALDLAEYPFKSRFDTPAKLMKEVLVRVQDPARPMPPAPADLLDPNALALLKEWQRDGLLKVHTPPKAATLRKYKVRLAWSNSGAPVGETTLDWRDDGIYEVQLGDLTIGNELVVDATLLDPKGKSVTTKSFKVAVAAPVPGSAPTPAPLAMQWQPPPAPAPKPPVAIIDKDPPEIGDHTVTVGTVTNVSVSLTWPAAHDDLTTDNALRYFVYTANAALPDLETVLSTGTLAAGPLIGDTGVKLVGMTPAKLYDVAVVVKDQAGNAAMYPSRRLTTGNARSPNTIVSYGEDCAARLGRLKPWSCLDGQVIPITVDGIPIPDVVPTDQVASYGYGNLASPPTCDRPALLGLGKQGQCVPYTRVGRLKSYRDDGSVHPDVDTMFTCRRYVARLGNTRAKGIDNPLFEDIAVIQHNRVTGETCFYQALETPAGDEERPSIDGRRIPPPDEAALPEDAPAHARPASAFWRPPSVVVGIRCITCHDSDPWMHSPYIDQVLGTDGKHIVFDGTKLGTWAGRYSVIGNRGFEAWPTTYAIESTVTTDTEGQSCTSCHNIGSEKTCEDWRRYATGTAPRGTGTTGRSFAHAYWMPPPLTPPLADVHAWESAGFKRAAERLAACCANPTAAGCRRTQITTLPPPYAAP